jgi:hypothetical protein
MKTTTLRDQWLDELAEMAHMPEWFTPRTLAECPNPAQPLHRLVEDYAVFGGPKWLEGLVLSEDPQNARVRKQQACAAVLTVMAMHKVKRARYVTSEEYADTATAVDGEKRGEVIEQFLEPDLLVLDGLCDQSYTADKMHALGALLNLRSGSPTVVVTTLRRPDLMHRPSGKRLDAVIRHNYKAPTWDTPAPGELGYEAS